MYISIKKRKQFNYESGEIFGRLKYTGRTYTKIIYGHWVRFIEAVCICGEVRDFIFHSVASGETKSCGCFRKDATSSRMKTHGLTKHPLYLVYKEMIKRCYDVKNLSFDRYGKRGIEVWKDWKDDFVCFYEWCIENGYKEGLSLDRKDNDGNYAPYNCRFVTVAEQNRNKGSNRFFIAFGETKCLWDWAADSRCIIKKWTLVSRVNNKLWEGRFEEALTTPIESRKTISSRNKSNLNLTAFGETKCMSEWGKDKRCVVSMDRLRDRIAEGWNHLEAITMAHVDKASIFLTAFGETKTMAEWLRDKRCVVKLDAVRDRYRKGWKHEDCLTTPPKTRIKIIK